MQSQKQQNDLCLTLRQMIQYHSNSIYAPTTNAKEVEVEWFYDDLQDLLELTTKKDVLFITGVQFSCSVVSDYLRPHELQHARLPCPSPTIGSLRKLMSIESVMPSSHLILCRPILLLPQSLPASGSFPMSQLFA